MTLHVARSEQILGTFSVEELHEALATGTVLESDFGWHEGMSEWRPVAELLPTLPASAPLPDAPEAQPAGEVESEQQDAPAATREPEATGKTPAFTAAADATILMSEMAAQQQPPSPAADPNVTTAMPQAQDATVITPAPAGRVSPPDSTAASTPFTAAASHQGEMPATLGGYQVLKELGHGGMGSVYLARQLSLNRNVALKVMKPQWASNATFVARFTREAYGAAQLTHHNVVQIYDFGEDRGMPYFSMEFVEGQTLGGLIRQKQRLDPEEACGYMLQAARGLKYAHDHSMIHRDIKPDNLLLNTQGVVKVADLGLVKTPEFAEAEAALDAESAAGGTPPPDAVGRQSATGSSGLTLAKSAMGTPAFMAPEQARDAARVDARADIYSLGCTLYDLVTGRPPFEGKTDVEVMSKHQFEPITPPDLVARRVPKELSGVILRMTAKNPDDRYPDLGEVIKDLENFLGVNSTGPYTPKEEHANLLEENVRAFAASPSARIRSRVIPAVLALSLVAAVIFAFMRNPSASAGCIGFGMMTVVFDFLVGGIRRKTHLFLKLRELAFTSPIGDWLMALAGVAVLVAVLFVFQLFWVWLIMGAVALGLVLALHATLDRRAAAERQVPLDHVEAVLRTLRLHAVEEDAVRQFVCKYSGNDWEEFYEALFGYEAKLSARERWGRGERAQPRPKFASWRDPVVSWIDARLRARREAKERSKLQKIEEKGLQAQGETPETARQKAQVAADAMVTMASEIQQSQAAAWRETKLVVTPSIAKVIREAEVARKKAPVDWDAMRAKRRRRIDLPGLLLGPKVRFLLGAALMAASLLWIQKNKIFTVHQVDALTAAVKSGDVKALTKEAQANAERSRQRAQVQTQPIEIPLVPKPVLALLSSFGAGLAGLFLVVSAFFRGIRIAFFAVPAAAITLLGPVLRLPAIPRLDPSLVPMLAGLAIMVLGVLLGRTKRR